MARKKIYKIEIMQNEDKSNYEVFIEGNRADNLQENKILSAVITDLRKKLPVSEHDIFIG